MTTLMWSSAADSKTSYRTRENYRFFASEENERWKFEPEINQVLPGLFRPGFDFLPPSPPRGIEKSQDFLRQPAYLAPDKNPAQKLNPTCLDAFAAMPRNLNKFHREDTFSPKITNPESC